MDLESANVWIVTDQPPGTGIGEYAIALFRLLRPAIPGLRLVDLHYFPHATWSEETIVDGVRTTGRFWNAPGTVRRNYRRLAQSHNDADLWHLVGSHYGFDAGSVPTVATVHDYYFRSPASRPGSDPRRLAIEAYSFAENFATARHLRRCSARISISETTRSELFRRTGLGSTVVHHWLDRSRFHPGDQTAARHRLGLPMDTTLILNVGSSSYNKNLGRIRKIADRLAPDQALVKVGARTGATHPRIVELGELGEDAYPLAFVASDAYLHTSSHEGFGRPLLEAMATGLPIISTDAPAAPEVLGDSALFIQAPYSPDQFARAITEAVRSSQSPDLRRRSVERARAFEPDLARAAYLTIYRSVLAGGVASERSS